jgi:hypothetical protein
VLLIYRGELPSNHKILTKCKNALAQIKIIYKDLINKSNKYFWIDKKIVNKFFYREKKKQDKK